MRQPPRPDLRRLLRGLVATAALGSAIGTGAVAETDARPDLAAGYHDAGVAARHVEHLATVPRADPLAGEPGDFTYANTDLAFQDGHVFVGNVSGIQVYDVTDPTAPSLVTTVPCPSFAGQHDVSVYGDLLFVSSESPEAVVECGGDPEGTAFAGIRVVDISDLAAPVQVAAVQTCRGSHTHTLVTDPDEDEIVYLYNSGVLPVRTETGCSDAGADDPGTDRWQIEVIEVPLAAPERARVIHRARLFEAGGSFDGLRPAERSDDHPAEPWELPPGTETCHDITAYPALGLAAGACEGHGLLLDISDPRRPVRLDAVADPEFAYWHSATFNLAGTKVVFTDEWGGGMAPRCRASDRDSWGADAIFDIVDGRLEFASYYKLPAPQDADENCVAHNGTMIPVPGRDVMVQAWYQGGVSVVDFTDSADPVEIAFFDRGPVEEGVPVLAGYWSAAWWNGVVYGSEIARGLDVLELVPSRHLSAAELAAAGTVRTPRLNPQLQEPVTWPPTVELVRAHLVQAERAGTLPAALVRDLEDALEAAAQQHEDDGPDLRSRSVLRDARADLPATEELAALRDALERLAADL